MSVVTRSGRGGGTGGSGSGGSAAGPAEPGLKESSTVFFPVVLREPADFPLVDFTRSLGDEDLNSAGGLVLEPDFALAADFLEGRAGLIGLADRPDLEVLTGALDPAVRPEGFLDDLATGVPAPFDAQTGLGMRVMPPFYAVSPTTQSIAPQG